MGFKGSEVQILSPRPEILKRNRGLRIHSQSLFSFRTPWGTPWWRFGVHAAAEKKAQVAHFLTPKSSLSLKKSLGYTLKYTRSILVSGESSCNKKGSAGKPVPPPLKMILHPDHAKSKRPRNSSRYSWKSIGRSHGWLNCLLDELGLTISIRQHRYFRPISHQGMTIPFA